jgi:hypothetical protein
LKEQVKIKAGFGNCDVLGLRTSNVEPSNRLRLRLMLNQP